MAVMFFSLSPVSAQIRVSASVDSTNYLIGDWIQVKISVDHPPGISVLWRTPLKIDTAIFPLISESNVDIIQQRDFLSENKVITFTTYDTGVLRIPAFTIYFRKNEQLDSAVTAPINILVSSIPVDTAKPFHPIKSPIAVAWKNKLWLYIASITILLLSVAVYWFLRRRKKQKLSAVSKQPVDLRSASEKALDKLDELEQEELWQRNLAGQYYIRLIQALREYLEEGLQIPAMEETTYEITLALKKKRINEQLLQQLRRDLLLADMVKFGRAEPVPEENIRTLETVRNFVQMTKPAQKTLQPEEVKT